MAKVIFVNYENQEKIYGSVDVSIIPRIGETVILTDKNFYVEDILNIFQIGTTEHGVVVLLTTKKD